MAEGHKRERVEGFIMEAVNSFVMENADTFGFSSARQITISDDLRKATVYIHFEEGKDSDKLIKKLEKSRREIAEIMNKTFSTKYMPSLYFEKIDEMDL